MGKAKMGLRAAALASVVAMTLAACGGGDGGDDADGGDAGASGKPVKGGTLTFLTLADQTQHIDPQRIYTGEDLAWTGAYLFRSLTAYKISTDEKEANTLVPDLATDTGTPNEDATSWQFTVRDGATWEDGSPVTCEDVKYGVSRTFATDLIVDGPQYAVVVPRHPEGQGRCLGLQGPVRHQGQRHGGLRQGRDL